MGKLLKIMVVIGIAVIAWILYVNYTEKQELKREQELRSREAAAREMQPESPGPPPPYYARPGLKTSTPLPPRRTSSPSHYQEVLAAARDTGVTILSYQESGNEATIRCKSNERNNLGNFLDALVNRGIIRDIDLDKNTFRKVTDRQLRWHFYATYVVNF